MNLAAIADDLIALGQRMRAGEGAIFWYRSRPYVRALMRARRMRDHYFPGGWFADPAWDMLLDLFAADIAGRRVSVSSLSLATSSPPTTALRWIARLTEAGLFVREPDPDDQRRNFVRMHPDVRHAMAAYLEQTWGEIRVASTSSGSRPDDAAPLTDSDAPAVPAADVSAHQAALSKHALAAAKPEPHHD